MDAKAFKREYLGEFVISEREQKIIERLKRYYDLTPDSMPNSLAIKHWREFTDWCRNNGYSSQDINRAKRSLRR